MDASQTEAMRAHYANLEHVRGHSTVCRMVLPEGLAGKRVLDLWCRSGKGAFAIGDQTGLEGFVMGTDPSAACIEGARARAPKSHEAGAEWERHLDLRQAFTEDLAAAGVDGASFDVTFVNSVINVAFDMDACLDEIRRVLAPGGYLYVMGAFAEDELPAETRAEMARAGNVYGAALTMDHFAELVQAHGFTDCTFTQVQPLEVNEEDAHPALEGRTFVETMAIAHVG